MTWPEAFAAVGIAFAFGAFMVAMCRWFEAEEVEHTKRLELILKDQPPAWVVGPDRQKGDGKGPLP